MLKAKGICEIYDEVKDCDLVITNDAPLATALNSRVQKASIGLFVYTPRQIAGKEAVRVLGKGIMGDLGIISAIADETGLDFKYIHGELKNIRTIRKYRANPENYLYSQSAKEVHRSFAALPTIEKVMSCYDPATSEFFKGRSKVAVIGLDLFDDLDKHFIPMDYKEVDLFTKGEYDISTIYQIGNDRQIADNVVDLISLDFAEDTAIVMDTEGPVADAIRATLYRKNIPFKNTMAVRDLSQIRDYLQFITLALNYDTIRFKHVREIFSNYGGYLVSNQDEYLFSKQVQYIKNERSVFLAQIMRNIRSMTFGEVMDKVVHVRQKPQIKILIDDLMMRDKKITTRLVNEMTYAVNNVNDLHHNEEIPDSEKRGVLLTNCNNSVYIDRPFVVFVGIGPEWSRSIIGKDYIDRDDEAEKELIRFSVLIQQGSSKIYAVNLMREGKPARPCSTFEMIYSNRKIESFDDVCTSGHTIKGPWYVTEKKQFSDKGEENVERTPITDWKFSKSTYNNFRECPRVYMFGKILRTPDSEYTVLGNIIHEFAELYYCYPEVVKEKGMDHYLSFVLERYSGISCDQMENIDRSSISISMLNIMRYVNKFRPDNVTLDIRNESRPHPNELMVVEGLEMCSSSAEVPYKSTMYSAFGDLDLVIGNTITDYKTGNAKDAKEIKNRMTSIADHPEYQPMIYLALINERNRSLPCFFNQFYVRDHPDESVSDPDFDVMRNVVMIEFIDDTIEGYLHSSDCCIKDGFGDKYKKYLSAWDSFIGAVCSFMGKPIDDQMKMAVLDSVEINDTVSGRKDAIAAINKIRNSIEGGMIIASSNHLIIPKDTVRSFMEQLNADHDIVSEMSVTNFPSMPMKDCSKCNFIQACTRNIDRFTENESDE